MFLLILELQKLLILVKVDLHSTMFLLIPVCCTRGSAGHLFTFHNVSINSSELGRINKMFEKFTFHNVSINSRQVPQGAGAEVHLHSTMFLLILERADRENSIQIIFTFHNVSINSRRRCYDCCRTI